jgi:uncharacterized membrane protein YfcA
MTLDLWSVTLLAVAAFAAGVLNAAAGGGSFLTLPALVATGVPPVAANATGTVAFLPGYAAGAWGFREDLEPLGGLSLRVVAACSVLGGLVGALLLLTTPGRAFQAIVPWLLLLATAVFAGAPAIQRLARNHATRVPRWVGGLGIVIAGIYGGYFNGGLGILLLALFGLLGQTKLNAMNGMKNLVSTLLTLIAVCVYSAGGLVQWPQAAVMAVAAGFGGYTGAQFARRIPPPVLRWTIVGIGALMSILFFSL